MECLLRCPVVVVTEIRKTIFCPKGCFLICLPGGTVPTSTFFQLFHENNFWKSCLQSISHIGIVCILFLKLCFWNSLKYGRRFWTFDVSIVIWQIGNLGATVWIWKVCAGEGSTILWQGSRETFSCKCKIWTKNRKQEYTHPSSASHEAIPSR